MIKEYMFKVILIFSLLLNCALAFANSSAVILQYHHVSDETPASTSISPEKFKAHLNWIKEHNFEVHPLPNIVKKLKSKQKLSSSKVLAITFDDANRSVCEIAWPILEQFNLPFTLFISTEGVEKGFESQCSWAQLKAIHNSGLMTVANHSHQHLNMISGKLFEQGNWDNLVKNEVVKAQDLIEENIGQASRLFAYPYGEYNSSLATIVTKLGYIGFGQHSGAMGFESDFRALPRFPASGKFANLDTLSVKLYSLAFPANLAISTENPINLSSNDNPPTLRLTPLNKSLVNTTNCFNGQGEQLPIKTVNNTLVITAKQPLNIGRHRYTCTSKSDKEGRFYWLSHQWLIEDNHSSWLSKIYKSWL